MNHGKRDKLEALGHTKIRTLDEFVAMIADGTVNELLPVLGEIRASGL